MAPRRVVIDYHSSITIELTNEWMRDIFNEFVTDKADFTAFSPKYANPYETNLENLINAAKNVVPDTVHVDILSGLSVDLEAKLDFHRNIY